MLHTPGDEYDYWEAYEGVWVSRFAKDRAVLRQSAPRPWIDSAILISIRHLDSEALASDYMEDTVLSGLTCSRSAVVYTNLPMSPLCYMKRHILNNEKSDTNLCESSSVL